jgi:hypothetical protein
MMRFLFAVRPAIGGQDSETGKSSPGKRFRARCWRSTGVPVTETLELERSIADVLNSFERTLSGVTTTLFVGVLRERNSGFGGRNSNKRTFVHGDCQRQPSTQVGRQTTKLRNPETGRSVPPDGGAFAPIPVASPEWFCSEEQTLLDASSANARATSW